MDGSISHTASTNPTVFMDSGQTIKPTVRRYSAARHLRDIKDIRMLKGRVLDAAMLSSDLIDWGVGHYHGANELEAALVNPSFAFTPRERADLQADADSLRGLALAARDELAALPSWGSLAKHSSWKELAQEAARREAIA